jgi:molecular chaperone GrpE (heat shock protein)
MKLDTFSRAKLLEKAKKLQIPGITDNITKTVLIEKLQPVVDANPSIMDDILPITSSVTPTVKVLTSEEKHWAAYLKKFNMTSAQFLKRYPNHPFRAIIEKL